MSAVRTISAFVREHILIFSTLPLDAAVVTFAPRIIAVPYAILAGAWLMSRCMENRHVH